MEVTKWIRNDELVSMLTSLSGHIQHGRRNDAIAVVRTIKKDGDEFREAVKTVNECVNQLFEQKKREMKVMQRKKGDIEDKIPSLNRGISMCEEKITHHKEEEEASRRRESQAHEAYQRADRDWDEGDKKTEFKWWYVAVPIVGQVAGICNIVSGENQKERAREAMSNASRDKERAKQALRKAREKSRTEKSKLGTIKHLVKECQSLVDELHTEVGALKNATAFTFELNKMLNVVLVVTDSALGKTGRLKTTLDRFMEKTGVLESRGTRTLLRTVGESWMEVRDLVVTIPRDRNALIWREAQRMTTLSLGRKALSGSGHLFSLLKTKLREGHASDAICTLMEIQAKSAYFEKLAEVEKEHLEERKKRAKEEMKRTEKRLSIETQLDSIGFDNNLARLRGEYRQQKEALEELTQQRKCLGQSVESVQSVRYKMGELRSTLKVCALVPKGIVRVFRSQPLLHEVGAIEDKWEALSDG